MDILLLLHLLLLIFFRLAVAAGPKVVLYPIPRQSWLKPSHHDSPQHGNRDGKRDYCCCVNITDVDFELLDTEQLLWGSPNETDIALFSVTIGPFPGQRIIDMGRLSEGIVEATCSEDMVLQLSQPSVFSAVEGAWEWVNQGSQRSFVLVGDPVLCKSGIVRDPWLVDHIAFDPATLVVRLKAKKQTWSEVVYEYDIDFGAAQTRSKQKRGVLDFNYDHPYQVPVATTIPDKLFTFHKGDSSTAEVEFEVNCHECGIVGKFVFDGHIAGNYLTGVKQLDLSLIPVGVQAKLNLEFLFSGVYRPGMYGLPDAQLLLQLYDVSLLDLIPAAWVISGMMELGPSVKIQAGVELSSLEGKASLKTGFTATVPGDSVARLALRSEDIVQVDGWVPSFEVQPITVDAQVSALVQFYTQIELSFDFVVFGQRGFRGALPFKFPNLEIDITAGTDHNGFCVGDPRPAGVKVQASLGAELSAVAVERMAAGLPPLTGNAKKDIHLFEPKIKEQIPLDKGRLELPLASRSLRPRVSLVKGEVTMAEEPIFDKQFYTFEPWCRSFGGEPPTCSVFTPEPDDQEWYEIEVDGAEDDGAEVDFRSESTLNTRIWLTPRAKKTTKKPKKKPTRKPKFVCGKKSTPFSRPSYPGPKTVVERKHAGGNKVPIMLPGIVCGAKVCPADQWTIQSNNKASVVQIPEPARDGIWSMDHVYEIDWLGRFWEELAVTEGLTCPKMTKDVLKLNVKGGYADQMLQAIGNSKTYVKMMTLLPKVENELKHRMFAKKALDTDFDDKTVHEKACAIGRIVLVCKYMHEKKTRRQLLNTLSSLDKVLKMMQGDANPKIAKLKPPKTFLLAHQEWFTRMYNDGIHATRRMLSEMAGSMLHDPAGLGDLDDKTRRSIEMIKKAKTEAEWASFCPNGFRYPGYEPPCGDIDNDPKNCGKCGNKCSKTQICKARRCVDHPADDGAFQPPRVAPLNGLQTEWSLVLFGSPFLNTWSYILPKDDFVKYGGKLTLNTRCIAVSELSETMSDRTATYLPNKVTFEWLRHVYETKDTCCLAVFRGPGCKANEKEVFCASGTDFRMPFDVHSLMVYGCRGLKREY